MQFHLFYSIFLKASWLLQLVLNTTGKSEKLCPSLIFTNKIFSLFHVFPPKQKESFSNHCCSFAVMKINEKTIEALKWDSKFVVLLSKSCIYETSTLLRHTSKCYNLRGDKERFLRNLYSVIIRVMKRMRNELILVLEI